MYSPDVQTDTGEVTIRRRPPCGIDRQPCGPVDFKVPVDEENVPRNILEEIVWHKAVEIDRWRQRTPLARLGMMAKQAPKARDFKGSILAKLEENGKPGLIAEVKKASPSKGVIQINFDPVRIAQVPLFRALALHRCATPVGFQVHRRADCTSVSMSWTIASLVC
jgi:indole-3-glycerol phosphate synthase